MELFTPNKFPEKINCIDKNGKKQGLWIIYKTSYNSEYRPDELDTGIYVNEYYYGEYKDNKKINTWTLMNNVHFIYDIRTDRFVNYKDSSIIESDWNGGPIKSCVRFDQNNKLKESYTIFRFPKDTVLITRMYKNPTKFKITINKKLIRIISYKTFLEYFDNAFYELFYFLEK